jgi:branched-chain amino acid transport system permease protein
VTTFLQDYPETRMIIYSLVLIIMMIYRPQGLMGTKEMTSFFKRKGGRKHDKTIA